MLGLRPHLTANNSASEHLAKDRNNTLSHDISTDGTLAWVKVCGRVGWWKRFEARITAAQNSGLIKEIFAYSELSVFHRLRKAKEWSQENENPLRRN